MNSTILPVHICFKGERNYLHGTDIYESLAQAANAQFECAIVRFQMSIHRFFNLQPEIHWFEIGHLAARPRNAVVDFSISSNSRGAAGWLVETDRPVDCRVPYDEDKIGRHCTFTDSCISIQGDSGYRPIEVVVSMTKQLHNRILRAQAGRWIFTKLDMRRLLEPLDATTFTVFLKENLHNRLTKSEITVGNESIGMIYFSLVR